MERAPLAFPNVACVVAIDELITWQQVFQRDDVNKWKEATYEKYHTFMKNETWEFIKLSRRRITISNKWVFQINRKANSEVDRYHARLVAKGFLQTKGIVP